MNDGGETGPEAAGPKIPWQQALTDDVFLLLMAGLVVPTIFYIVWGLLELANVKIFVPTP
jgi:hypothetical protein